MYSEPLVRKTVTLPVSYVEQLTTFGTGNRSDGIRLLADNAYARNARLSSARPEPIRN